MTKTCSHCGQEIPEKSAVEALRDYIAHRLEQCHWRLAEAKKDIQEAEQKGVPLKGYKRRVSIATANLDNWAMYDQGFQKLLGDASRLSGERLVKELELHQEAGE